MNLETFLKKHPTVSCASLMRHICRPLEKLGIVYFSHAHISSDQRMTTIGLDPDFFQHYFNKGYQQYDLHMSNPEPGERIILWDTIERIGKSKELHEDFVSYGHAHTFSIIKAASNGVDCYHFAAKVGDITMNSKYLQLVGELKMFINYFTDEVNKHKELKAAYNLGIRLNKDKGGYLIEDSSQISEKDTSVFKAYLDVDRIYINNNDYLTKRELETLHWIAQGKTLQEVGIILNISHRTVKAHVENIKVKLGCRNLFQLGVYYSKLRL